MSESTAPMSTFIFPPVCSTRSEKLLAIDSTISLRSRCFFLNDDFLRSNIDICSTFSTRKRRRLVSSVMTPTRCFLIFSLFVTLSSLSICVASDMLAIGVFSSCVMLFTKSFLISLYRFCLNTNTRVMINVTRRMSVKNTLGIMNLMLEKM